MHRAPIPAALENAGAAEWAAALTGAVADIGRGAVLRLTLAPGLLRWMTVDAPEGTSGLRELRELAAARFEDLFGEVPQRWVIRGDWRATGLSLCVAIPAGLAEALDGMVGGHSWTGATSVERTLAASAGALPTGKFVWIEVVGGFATLLWFNDGWACRVVKVRVDEHQPWTRVGTELTRAEAECGDGWAVHWIAPASLSGAAHLSWTRHRLPAADAATVGTDSECWAAAMGGLS